MERARVNSRTQEANRVSSETPAPAKRIRETDEERERMYARNAHIQGYRGGGYSIRHTRPLHAAWKASGEPRQANGFLLDLPTETARAKRQRAWDALKAEGGWVLLLGDRGTGKTQMAAEFGFRLATEEILPEVGAYESVRGYVRRQHYTTLLELFSEEKATWRNNQDSTEPLRNAGRHPFLVLDEVQERSDTAWEDAQLSVLLDRRYRDMLRTVLISNLSVEGAKQKLPASVWSRLTEAGAIVHCDWPSFRVIA